MRSLKGRGMRLELVAALGTALALPALAFPAANSAGVATETTLNTQIQDLAGHTQANLTVTVTGQDGALVAGAVSIEDAGKPLAGIALDVQGHAIAVLSLAPGEHHLAARYLGDASHQQSVSQVAPVRAQSGATPGFGVTTAPTTLSLAQGQSGSVIATVTPSNADSLTAPMFVTLSCSGLPDQSNCTFNPENIEILPNATAGITSTMVLATSAGSSARAVPPATPNSTRIAWAVLLPGSFGLIGLAFGARRRSWLRRLSLFALVGFVSVLGTAACSPLYNYHNHGPPHNLPTPAGSYTVKITAQSSNGITAITQSTSVALTVQ
ncbi:MAG TPA: Ig-like domain-containing protein [Terracidiphilus sp.]|nr:Ig-like domain-containing protein [Terracidiphilus sp.]